MAMEVAHFHGENLVEFCVVHRQVFTPVYMAHANMLVLGWVGALQSIKHIDSCCINEETDVNQVTWIKTITLRWSCTQYTMSMHLQQFPWTHTQTTRLRALMTGESPSNSHESPSYKVHDHPHTGIYIYIHTYIMHNTITQSRKVNQTLPTFQGYSPARYRKSKIDIAIRSEWGPSKV